MSQDHLGRKVPDGKNTEHIQGSGIELDHLVVAIFLGRITKRGHISADRRVAEHRHLIDDDRVRVRVDQ